MIILTCYYLLSIFGFGFQSFNLLSWLTWQPLVECWIFLIKIMKTLYDVVFLKLDKSTGI